MTSICQLIELKEGTNHYLQSCVFPCINSASHNVTFYHTITLIYRQYNTLVLLTHCSETLQSSNVGFHQYSSDQWFRLARLELQCCPFKQCGISNFLVPTMFTAVCDKKMFGPFREESNFAQANSVNLRTLFPFLVVSHQTTSPLWAP